MEIMSGRALRLVLALVAVSAGCAPTGVWSERLLVGMTLVRNAPAIGAYCLDGSLPAYHLHRGFGAGANSWLLQFEQVAALALRVNFFPQKRRWKSPESHLVEIKDKSAM
ncbi:hypothetical protein CRG98_028865 [Punica granatum]|uniref:Pectin acetylesterase n=1 Tax=Punica granatum TaxID=22663 RepID=A0A2I0J3U8_PUNGR|nr:hypothetical protein CRG98_028865 [Punica granatum]